MRPALLLTLLALLLVACTTTGDDAGTRAAAVADRLGAADVQRSDDDGWVQADGTTDGQVTADVVAAALAEGGWEVVSTSTFTSGAHQTLGSDGPDGVAVTATDGRVVVRAGPEALNDPWSPADAPAGPDGTPGAGLPDAPSDAMEVVDVPGGETAVLELDDGAWTVTAVAAGTAKVTVALPGLDPFPARTVEVDAPAFWPLAGPDDVTVTVDGADGRVWVAPQR